MSVSKRKQNREKWQSHMDSWGSSGLSQREYCLKNGIKYLTFINWRKQLKKERENNDNGLVRMDNNLIENTIRPFVIGRKNWLFSVSQEGARASALFYSLIKTAKANGLEPYRYLKYLFEKYPYAETYEDIFNLLPMNVSKIELKK